METPYSKDENEQAWTAWQCLTRTNINLFLTGRAGTGKTTFLRKLADSHLKSMVITAPTGVAAINAGGVTIHSFFQIPPGTFPPGERPPMERKIRTSKLRVIRSLDLLVIDEVSMVRADLLDMVDARLREIRQNERPFGGVQLLLIGDLMQLAPVVTPQDLEILGDYYPTPYFFASKALARTQFYTIGLEKIYRQTDAQFIGILNQVRTGRASAETLDKLNSRCNPGFAPKESEGYIRMTTHVKAAEDINEEKLQALKAEAHHYESRVAGDFPEQMYPTTNCLTLKKGAQVMFIRNDNHEPRRYYNGKIGKVTSLSKEQVTVRCEDTGDIDVGYSSWENIKYEIDEKSGQPVAKTAGTFSQIPLALAWAITIHKSQGLTFDKAIIDASRSFSAGQVYVALSRCRTFEGLVLKDRITPGSIRTAPAVADFYRENERTKLTSQAIDDFASDYAVSMMRDLFTFDAIFATIRRIVNMLERDYGGRYGKCLSQLDSLMHIEAADMASVGTRFIIKCEQKRACSGNITEDEGLMEQTRRGAKYFEEKLDDLYDKVMKSADISLDDAAGRKRLSHLTTVLTQEYKLRKAEFAAVEEKGFSPATIMSAKAKAISEEEDEEEEAELKKKTESRSFGAEINEVENKELFAALREWRRKKAEEEDAPAYVIAANKTLFDIADTVPLTAKELSQIRGMGKEKIKKYGNDILSIVSSFHKKGTKPAKHATPAAAPAKEKIGTKAASLEAFRRLGSVADVARERGLTRGTITGHLMSYVGTELSIDDIMGAERHKRLAKIISAMPEGEKPDAAFWAEYDNHEYHYVRKELGKE